MFALKALLPIALLLNAAIAADHHASVSSPNDLETNFYEILDTRINNREKIENFALFSINHPSRMTYRFMNDQVTATIERTMEDDKTKQCVFQPFEDKKLEGYSVRLRSMSRKNMEVFEVAKIYKDSMDNFLNMFVVNMMDCKVTKTMIMKGQSHEMYRSLRIVVHPSEKHVDIFTFNGTSMCGSYACKRTYDVDANAITEPKSFDFMKNDAQDWELKLMAEDSDNDYYALVSRGMAIKLVSLTHDGVVVNSTEDKIDSALKFLKVSTSSDLFGACYVEEKTPKMAQCMQLDHKLNVVMNKTVTIDENVNHASMYNLPNGGMILLTAHCPKSVKLIKIKTDGSFNELTTMKDDDCVSPTPKGHEFRFYEGTGNKLCAYYACQCDGGKCGNVVKSKCFGDIASL